MKPPRSSWLELLVIVSTYSYVRVGRTAAAEPRRIALAATVGLSLVLAATVGARLLLHLGDANGPSLFVYEVTLCLIAGGLLAGLIAAPWRACLSLTSWSRSARPVQHYP